MKPCRVHYAGDLIEFSITTKPLNISFRKLFLFNRFTNEYHEYKQSKRRSSYRQKPDVALRELRKLASDRQSWVMLAKSVCEVNKKKKFSEIEV